MEMWNCDLAMMNPENKGGGGDCIVKIALCPNPAPKKMELDYTYLSRVKMHQH